MRQRYNRVAPILFTGGSVNKNDVLNNYYVKAWGKGTVYYLIRIQGKTNPLLVASSGALFGVRNGTTDTFIHDQSRAEIGKGTYVGSSKDPRRLLTNKKLRLYTFK